MRKNGKNLLCVGSVLIVAFVIWTWMIQVVDVQSVGVNGTDIGFAAFNTWFHELTGVHMTIYVITDWLGLIPIFVCMIFGGIGFVQLVRRRSLLKLDCDIILLGVYYVIVIFGYLIFEMIPVNYRPILIEGFMEASYPSSTTLLVLSVMPTLSFQVKRRLRNPIVSKAICGLVRVFSVFIVLERLFSGVHWFTDIVGSVILSTGLFYIYQAVVLLCCKEKNYVG